MSTCKALIIPATRHSLPASNPSPRTWKPCSTWCAATSKPSAVLTGTSTSTRKAKSWAWNRTPAPGRWSCSSPAT